MGVYEVADDDRPRLDHYLARREPALSRSQLKRLIEDGRVTVNGAPAKASAKLRAGDHVVVVVPPPEPAAAEPEDIPLVVLFEDEHVVVVDKPAGLVVHPAPGHPSGTLVNALLAHCGDLSGIGGELRPGIVHRLDKDTSGVLVATKTDLAHQALAAGFADKTHEREYVALVAPPPRDAAGTISTLHGRHPAARKKFSSKVTRGKTAITHYRVEERLGRRAAVLRCRLETGRTHQIRVHCSDSGFPVLADPLYARRPKDPLCAEVAAELGRQALHARLLAFAHPVTGEEVRCEAPVPFDMARAIERLRVAGR